MITSLSWPRRAAVLALCALTLGGCAGGTAETTAASSSPAASSAPAVSEPPSTPVVEHTLRDTVDGTAVTPLAIVTDFPIPADATPGVRPVLVKVRLEAGDKYASSVFPSVVSITPRDANLDYIRLGMSNPDTLTPAMAAAGYTPLQPTQAGTTSTAWIGAWMRDDGTEFDLVYDRPEGAIFGGSRNGEKVEGSRDITPLVVE